MIHSILGRGLGLASFVAVGGSALAGGTDIPDQPPLFPLEDLGCTEFDRYEVLTPNDTLTLVTSAHNPEQALGYAVVYAVDDAGDAISANYLIGSQLSINGIDRFEYSVNPVDFRSPVADGEAADLDGDGEQDLDGAEYEMLPDELLIPRFIGQSTVVPTVDVPVPLSFYNGHLILIDLNSGNDFATTVDFLSYNDNEEVFSGEYTFRCWEKPSLLDISGVYGQNFLSQFTNQNENESVGGRETGWFKFWGHVANSSAASIADPGIYGVYVERVGQFAAADLPFEQGSRDGHILPRSIFGDNSEGSAPAGVADDNIQRRLPGSLLVYPEFDNLDGHLTLFTVTNSSATEEVRVHFVYRGKYGHGGAI